MNLAQSGPFPGSKASAWYHAVSTAKHLRRGELWWAKLTCDAHMKGLLRRAFEWDAVAAGRDPWFRGRFLEEWVDPVALRGLRTAFARYDEDEVLAALAATMDLCGEVSQRTAVALGLSRTRAMAAEEHARALVAQLRPTRPAARG